MSPKRLLSNVTLMFKNKFIKVRKIKHTNLSANAVVCTGPRTFHTIHLLRISRSVKCGKKLQAPYRNNTYSFMCYRLLMPSEISLRYQTKDAKLSRGTSAGDNK